MKKRIIYLCVIFAVGFTSSASGQYTQADSQCACKKFPYFYCTQAAGQQSEIAYCTDNPSEEEGPGNPLGLNVAVRENNPFTCIMEGPIDNSQPDENPGDQVGFGYVLIDGVWVPGVNLDNTYYPSTGGGPSTVGTTMAPGYGGEPSYLSSRWVSNLGGALHGDSPGSPSCVTYNTTCCISIMFVFDSSFYTDPDRVYHNLDCRSVAGYVEPNLETDCRIVCSDTNPIYINATPQFLYNKDSVDYTNDPPIALYNDFVVDGGTGGIPTHSVNVGAYYDWYSSSPGWNYSPPNIIVNHTIDFVSVIMHEMGHWLGIPDRTVQCANTNGGPCGTPDPNSVMNGTLTYGKETENFTSDDDCWLRKLYCPSDMPLCATDAVEVPIDPNDINLEQSVPNPTTGGVEIGYSVDRDLKVTMVLYDILGKRIMTIQDHQIVTSGHHIVSIAPNDLPSGKYIYSLSAGDIVLSKEMTVVK